MSFPRPTIPLPSLSMGNFMPKISDDEIGATRTALANCSDGEPCRVSRAGASCDRCGYPRAYVHPDGMSIAVVTIAKLVNGSAMQVTGDPLLARGVMIVVRRVGGGLRREDYALPREVEIDDAARAALTRDLLTRSRLEASAYPTLNHEDHLQIFLEDVEDKHWPVWLAVIVDVPDLTAAVQAYLTEHFPESTIPPLTVVRR